MWPNVKEYLQNLPQGMLTSALSFVRSVYEYRMDSGIRSSIGCRFQCGVVGQMQLVTRFDPFVFY